MQIINTLYHNILEGEKYINNLNLNNYNNTEINHILLNSRVYLLSKQNTRLY